MTKSFPALLLRKLYDNFNYDRTFVSSKRLTLSEKIEYLGTKYTTYPLLLGRRRGGEISYLGHKFKYDNLYTPILLQSYPREIEELDEAIGLNNINSVLDIGANVGQWAFTLKSFFPHIKVTSLEPNPKIFDLLKDNNKVFEGWESHNLGVGNGKIHRFLYYSGNGSAEASVFENSEYESVPVKLIELDDTNIRRYKLQKTYDLVKVDVEGAELEVLKAIRAIRFGYLTVEVAVQRTRGVRVSDVERFFLKNTNLKPKLVFLQVADNSSLAGNATFSLRAF